QALPGAPAHCPRTAGTTGARGSLRARGLLRLELLGLLDPVLAAPELDRVEEDEVAEQRERIDGDDVEAEEHELVHELRFREPRVPARDPVVEVVGTDAGRRSETGGERERRDRRVDQLLHGLLEVCPMLGMARTLTRAQGGFNNAHANRAARELPQPSR